ncbi:transporter [Ganoderma sinense ZZ0214-1]|uniref:Transporter n=1 Tax=Ganoderma sinense ZZ0214-1 TaxID=1077348 RepID=A0A2G8STE6_9APHY|nr:transporter [Ganoderma sinense ZZ0214-1]
MLKFWPSNAADLTPRAGPNGQERKNPFDAPDLVQSHQQASASPASQPPPPYHHSLLSTPHHLLTPTLSGGLAQPVVNGPEPPSQLGPLTPSAMPLPSALPTTGLSLHAPVFNMQQPPSSKRQNTKQPGSAGSSSSSGSSVPATNGTSTPASSATSASSSMHPSAPSKGQIHVKLIQARSLNVRSSTSRPYLVVQFEQNEFVSRDPTDETDKEVKGIATNLSALSALGAINSKASSKQGSARSSALPTPSSSFGSGKSQLQGTFGSRISAHNPVWKHEVSFDVTSEQSVITLSVYDRALSEQPFLGTVQIKPALVHDHTTKRALTPRDFEFLKLIGRGTFGRVFQVRKRDTKRIYAMKVLSKREIIEKKEVAHTIGERKILQRSLECPFLVGLKFSFQTETDLYLVTDFKSGGELFWHLQKETRFSEERARFYVAELILALEHLHKYDIVYRDLKPENILLDATGHVALCDFGLSKPDLQAGELTNTFCGTTEYLAPEVLLDEHGYSKLVDFWSLGVLLFEMCCGWSPFYAEDTQQMYKNICFGKIKFPKGVINEDGKQFVKGLLNRNPKHRLGAQRDAAELKEHPFFKVIDWDALSKKQVTPPFKPVVESDESVANFDPEFTSADMREVGVEEMDLDDEDPSPDWVALSQSVTSSTMHTPLGPLGSDKPAGATSPSLGPAPAPAPAPPQRQGIEIAKSKKKRDEAPPLTNSVQENFRGFTYHGESIIAPPTGILAREQEEAVVDDAAPYPTTDDEVDNDSPAGRYARRNRDAFDGFDDDMNL